MIDRRQLLVGMGAAAVCAAIPDTAAAAPLAKVKQLGVLRVSAYLDNRPWSWMQDGRLVGIDVEIAEALAKGLGVRADLAGFAADESVDDDLRNTVWRGGLLGFVPADVMMHVPFDRKLALDNDQAVIAAPYYREGFGAVCGTRRRRSAEMRPVCWRTLRVTLPH